MTSHSMKALVVPTAEAAFEIQELRRPEPGRGQVLVRIAASGVNPLDTKIRAGKADHARQPLPAVLGMDLAGTVVTVGAGVTDFKAGDEIFGLAGGIGGLQGTLAEYAAVDERLIALKPAALSMREAAALPLAVITAWEGLVDRAQVGPGQRVLVHGGAGGVGHIVIQLAKARGAQVFATGSAAQADFIRKLGATPIDYRAQTVGEYVQQHTDGRGFDIVYDTVGGASLDASFTAARKYGGHVLSILGWGTHSLAPLSFRAATYSGVFTLLPMLTGEGCEHHGEILRAAAALVDAGALRPLLDPREFKFVQATEAHELVASGKTTGKVVVDVTA
ncbi:MAG: zinc-dependent alcohol dehydrogenase family protein [Paucibacter sp.]|nr:zinc-dependent alcohol dehydrogenase family protein [Roseateles sp.]